MLTMRLVEEDRVVRGLIIDSWVERAGDTRREPSVVLQVRPWGRSRELWIIEAPVSLVPDAGWLEDLSANLCHGSPVVAAGPRKRDGLMTATRLELGR
jgi:hypothetical protein